MPSQLIDINTAKVITNKIKKYADTNINKLNLAKESLIVGINELKKQDKELNEKIDGITTLKLVNGNKGYIGNTADFAYVCDIKNCLREIAAENNIEGEYSIIEKDIYIENVSNSETLVFRFIKENNPNPILENTISPKNFTQFGFSNTQDWSLFIKGYYKVRINVSILHQG